MKRATPQAKGEGPGHAPQGEPSPKQMLRDRNLLPDKRFGQNFLVDGNMQRFLLRQAELTPDVLVLEIGAGIGHFTAQLAREAGFVVAVEIDRRLVPVARENLEGCPNVELLAQSVMAEDYRHIDPKVLETVRRRLADRPDPRLRVVSNLPYGSASTILVSLLESGLPIERIVATVQWEVAGKLSALPGDRENGALSLLIQSMADVKVLRKLPPSVFWPPPNVNSAAIRVTPRTDRDWVRAADSFERFKTTLHWAFKSPRKTLANSLEASGGVSGPQADRLLAACGIDPKRRPQTLAVDDVFQLSRRI